MKIKRFIKQRCMGYSQDFKSTHWQHEVELWNGETKTVYSTDNRNWIGELTERVPKVDRVEGEGLPDVESKV